VKKPPVHALDELNRPGWEPLYAYMKQVCGKAARLKQEHPPCAVERRDFLSRRFAAADREDMPETPMSAPSFFLLGPPGVGKTTAARLIGRCFYEHGLLKKGHVVETSQADLVSSYVGGIHINVQQKCSEAEEGVLLIDDAKTLLTRDAGDQHAPTGKVILEALVPEMTRRRFCCIISGYQETRELLKCDAGLMRRFGDGKGINVVELQGYTPEVLERVMLRVIADKGRTLDPALTTPRANGKTPLRCMLERVYHERDRSSFGNADWVQKTVMDAISAAESSSAALKEADFIGQGGIRAEFFQDQYDDQTIAGVLDDFRKQYVGMDQVEAFLKTVGRTVIDARQRGKSLEDLSCSAFILSGNPGSGKTSATKALSRLLFSLELLGTPEPIVCSASSLNSSYVHGNMEKLNALVKEAQDKRALLFIDEASQFLDGREKDLKAFIEPLTDHSHPFMVVLACYPQDADRLLACDPGNARRYMRLDLPDYSGDELHRILLRMADAQGMQVASDASGMLRVVCEAIARFSPPDNKNAGAVENLLRFSLEQIHLERINPDCLPNPPAYATPEAFTYTAEDVNLLLDRAAVPLTPEQCRWVREQLQGV
ncbi:MAG: AAA family ATPase, partial [Aristaeellaceae bacterium]